MITNGGLFASLPDARSTIETDSGVGRANESAYRSPVLDSFAAAMMGTQGSGVERHGENHVAGISEPYQADVTTDFAAALGETTQTESVASAEDQSHQIEDFASTQAISPEAHDIFSAQNLKDEHEVLITRALLEAHKTELQQAVEQARATMSDQRAFEAEARAAEANVVKPGIYDLTFYRALISQVLTSTTTIWAGNPTSAETWTQAFNHKRKRRDENSFAAIAG